MNRVVDHDGKSKTASAMGLERYPDPGDNADGHASGKITQDAIAARAHQFWLDEGQPEHCAERHWLEAERDLQRAEVSRSLLDKVKERGGSVQP